MSPPETSRPETNRDVLILGATGQVGRALGLTAWSRGLTPRPIDRVLCDITDPRQIAAVVAAYTPAAVVNAAAYTAVDQAEQELEEARRVNALAPGWIAEVCREHDVPFVHISTDYVFDGEKPAPYTEDDPVAPLGVYGQTKEAGERAVRDTTPKHVIVRTQWVYSEHGRNFCKTMLRLEKERDRLDVVDDQHGAPTLAQDIATAITSIVAQLLDADARGPYGTWHFANAGATTWCGFARRIFAEVEQRTGRPPPRVEPIRTDEYPALAPRPRNSRFDCSRIERDFDVRPRPWQDALSDCLDVVLSDTEAG